MRKSRVYPDLTAMRIGEYFFVESVGKRNNVWPIAKAEGVRLSSKLMPNGHFMITKIAGETNYMVPSPILHKAGSADELHYKTQIIEETNSKKHRSGIQRLITEMEEIEPTPLEYFYELPKDVLDLVAGILAHKEPVNCMHWLYERYEATTAWQIIKRGLLELLKSKFAVVPPKIEQALEILDPKYENGLVIVAHSPRHLSKDVVELIGETFGVQEIYVKIPVHKY